MLAETLKPARGVDLAQVLPVTAVLLALAVGVLVLCWAYRKGRTPALERAVGWCERESGLPGWAAIPAMVSSLSLLTAGFGFYWDVAVHIDRGRDNSPFGTPAHWPIVLGLCGLALAGILAIALDKDVDGKAAVVLPGGLRCSLGGALVLLCGSISLAGFPLDDIWHNIFGQDVTLWSPTHIQMVGGASLTTLATWVLIEEGRRRSTVARGSGTHALARLMRPQPIHMAGAFLIGLSTLQDEFDMGVPQFNAIYHPILLALAAGIGLVAARVRIGKYAALRAAVFFIVVRAIWMVVIGYGFSLSIPHMPLYLAEAAIVELVALWVPVSQQVRFGAVAGLLIGTVGIAAEWAWSQVAFPLPWGAVLWQGYVLAAVAGTAAGVLGGLTGRALLPSDARRAATPRLAVGLAFAAALGVVAVALPIQDHSAWQADVTVTQASPHLANLTVRLDPASAADSYAWFNVTSWQGGDLVSGHGLRITAMRRDGDVWRTTNPVPVAGDYKSVLRLATGTSQQAVPIYLPEDKAIPAALVPASPHFTRSFVQDQKILQREAIGGSPALKHTAYAVLGILALLWIASLSLGLRRLDQYAVAPSTKPLRLAGAFA